MLFHNRAYWERKKSLVWHGKDCDSRRNTLSIEPFNPFNPTSSFWSGPRWSLGGKKDCVTKWFRGRGVEGPLQGTTAAISYSEKGSEVGQPANTTGINRVQPGSTKDVMKRGQKGVLQQNLPPTQTSRVIGWINTRLFSSSLPSCHQGSPFKVTILNKIAKNLCKVILHLSWLGCVSNCTFEDFCKVHGPFLFSQQGKDEVELER